jgi:anaerobic magnesium-protoporphyrin IX monomethyl ester cyclase
MRRVVLFYPSPKFGGPIHPRIELPQSLLTIATPLDAAGYEVRIIDQRVDRDWRERLLQEADSGPLCVGVSSMTGPQIRNGLTASRLIHERCRAPVVWGGVHPTLRPRQTVEHPDVDIVVEGEGEETLLDLVRALERHAPLSDVRGIWYKDGGAVRQTEPRPLIDLNQQPQLAYHLVDVHRYLVKIDGEDYFSFETSRGCQYKCAYCYNCAAYGSRWRGLTVDETLQRLRRAIDAFGIRRVLFTDDNFFGSKERALSILTRLRDERWGIRCGKLDGHPALMASLRDEELRLIRDSGCNRLMMGIESGSPRVLALMRKEFKIPDLLALNCRLADHDIVPHYFFMMGYPTETRAELKATTALFLRLNRENRAAIPRLSIYTPFPGTELFDLCVEHGLEAPSRLEDWVPMNFSTLLSTRPWISAPRRETIRTMHFTSLLAIRSNFVSPYKQTQRWVRLLAALYYPVARARMSLLFSGLPVERRLAELTGVYPTQV